MHRTWLTQESFCTLEPGFLSHESASSALMRLQTECVWEHREVVLFGKRVKQPRLIAWSGELPYRYSGQTLEPRVQTPQVGTLLRRINEATLESFNHVLLNRYRDQNDSMGLHADNEPELGRGPVVATLSLGETRRLQIVPRRNVEPALALPKLCIELAHGSLLVMGGQFQSQFLHGIPKEKSERGERISLTFRKLLRTPT